MLSNSVFILYGAPFLAASFAFWQVGRTDMARAYVIPILVAGVLLLILSGGQLCGTWNTLAAFGRAVAQGGPSFVAKV